MVLCSLALHHFSNDDAVRVLQKIRDLSTARILVADLRRARWLSCAVYFVTATIYRDEMTKTDARLSAARAFSFLEMRNAGRARRLEKFQASKVCGWTPGDLDRFVDPEHSRRIPLRYLKDSIMTPRPTRSGGFPRDDEFSK